ncbi:DUF378 domain-containing protein [Chengkuizengella axinellae]|uniref:DUF378 domain-containing protein n=1 Tax=Chengkuizengella axinellae TaxID=3064388 RepID=A0ABT9J499_9BACL|nr:DUF378 domain-containing protein [Chengkuizengella sp. 2205SS18-9]MDP5275805.1 DUF378 domain-containing protein [Chengkuizengella sp. 2205SS18-9]
MKTLNVIALLLVIIGGLNWLLVGIFEWDLVAEVFGGTDSVLSKIIYIVIGLSAIYSLSFFNKITQD